MKMNFARLESEVPVYKSKKKKSRNRRRFLWLILWVFGLASTVRAVMMNYNQYSQFLSVVNQKSYDFHSSTVSVYSF